MRMKYSLFAFAMAGSAVVASPAFAASAVQKECSAKYQAAKSANQLNGMDYRAYYKQCAAEAKAEKAGTAAPAAPAKTTATAPAAPAPMPAAPTKTTAAPAPTTTAAPTRTTAAPAAPGAAVFPTAVSSEFSSLKPGQARMKTCLAQYKKNKEANGNGGLKWIEKGGGYYSECNKRLKG